MADKSELKDHKERETARIGTEIVCSFRPSKTFAEHKDCDITSIDFDDNGEFFLSCANDESIQIYDVNKGTVQNKVYSRKYGAALARFTHNSGTSKSCIYASTKVDDTIRYLTFHDNSYVRYFRGHEKRVNSIEVSPLNDWFLSSSEDNTVKLWDLRSPTVHGSLFIPSPMKAVYDATSVLFCVASEKTKSLSLYDVRNFDKQPFSLFKIDTLGKKWSNIEFSNDGKYILLSTMEGTHYVLDSFSGELFAKLVGHMHIPPPKQPNTGHTCFSQDGRFVFSGSADKKIYVWDLLRKKPAPDGTLKPITALDSPTPPALLAMNPQMMVLATANQEVTLWLPSLALNDKGSVNDTIKDNDPY